MTRHLTSFRRLSIATLLTAVCFSLQAQYTFTTLAGPPDGPGTFDGTRTAARLYDPRDVAVDSANNVYVADSWTQTIRKITPDGVVTTFAGLAESAGSADGTGSQARFYAPAGIAIDSSNNVYVADTSNHTIRKITPAGVVSTLAGSPGLSGSTDGTGSAARFNGPTGIDVDGSGNVFVADFATHIIRKITPDGLVTTLAGSPGVAGSTDGTGSAALFKYPTGLAVDVNGDIYVADSSNHTIRKVTQTGIVTTLAGTAGSPGSTDGTGSAARFNCPYGVAVRGSGNVYVADGRSSAIRVVTKDGIVTTLAGSLGGPSGSEDGSGSAARFYLPVGIGIDSGGNLYVADANPLDSLPPIGNHTIRKVTPAGVVTTFVGSASPSGSTDATGAAARFSEPTSVAVDGSGNVYVADRNNQTIRKITSAGVVSTLAGSPGLSGSADGNGSAARFRYPSGVAVDGGGNVYVADTTNCTIRKITSAGEVTTLAGWPRNCGNSDNTGQYASFNGPSGVAVDANGNVYVADTNNHSIRKVTPGGAVTTIIGWANAYPAGVAVDGSGNLYVTDSSFEAFRGLQKIHKISPGSFDTVIAGSGALGNANGTGSAAKFCMPSGVAVDGAGNVFVADTYNNEIRKITPGGTVTTIGGLLQQVGGAAGGGAADGTGSVARFYIPYGVAVDANGNVYVADRYNHKIRVGRPALLDVATIDSATGNVGATRQLGTAPNTATSWQWSIVRRPSGSTADVSSSSTRNPTFVPDIPDLYVFRLVATGTTATSITHVALSAGAYTALPPPASVAATGSSASVSLSWSAVGGASGYRIYRKGTSGGFTAVGTSTSTSFIDRAVTASSTYAYRVRSYDPIGESADSNTDLATTVVFVDSTLTPALTVIKAVHLTQLQSIINDARVIAGLSPVIFTDGSLNGTPIRATHILELRSALSEARSALGMGSMTFTDSSLPGLAMSTVHVTEIRSAVR